MLELNIFSIIQLPFKATHSLDKHNNQEESSKEVHLLTLYIFCAWERNLLDSLSISFSQSSSWGLIIKICTESREFFFAYADWNSSSNKHIPRIYIMSKEEMKTNWIFPPSLVFSCLRSFSFTLVNALHQQTSCLTKSFRFDPFQELLLHVSSNLSAVELHNFHQSWEGTWTDGSKLSVKFDYLRLTIFYRSKSFSRRFSLDLV